MPNSYRNPNVSYRKFSFYELNGYDIDFHKSDDSDSEKDNDQSDSDLCDNEIDRNIQNPGTVRRKKSSGETAKITWKFKKLEADDNICRSKCLSRHFKKIF